MAESSAVSDRTQSVLQAVSQSSQASEQPASEVTEFFGSLRPAISQTLLYIILLFVAVAIAWAWWGKVDVVASAPFRLVPLGKVKTVQAARAGEIELIGVKAGDRVKKRQVLFKLRSWETWHELRELEQAKITLQKAKYDLEVALPRKQALTTETVVALKERVQLAQMFVATHRDVLDAYQTEMGAQNARSVSGKDADLKARINLRQAEVAHIKAQYERQKALFDRGLISQADMERARMAYLNALAQLPGRMSEIYQQEMAVQDIKRQILEAELSQDREASQAKYAYDAARLRLQQAQQKVARNLDAESDLILAPEAGIVTQVLVNTERQVISKGQSLAMIAPETAPIVAEVMILNKDVGLMKPGQVVRLKYDAFAFQDYGIKRGWLSEIAPDAWLDQHGLTLFDVAVEAEYRLYQRWLMSRIKEDSIRAFFVQRTLSFERVEVCWISVSDEGVAEELCLQVKEEGADFYTLARRYSQDEATRSAGGYLGRRRRRNLPQGVAPLIFAASEGDVVGPVKVEKGYALYYVQKRCPAVLDETTCEKIRRKLFESYLQREMKRAEITFPFNVRRLTLE